MNTQNCLRERKRVGQETDWIYTTVRYISRALLLNTSFIVKLIQSSLTTWRPPGPTSD